MNTQENHTSKKPAHLHIISTTIALDGISTQTREQPYYVSFRVRQHTKHHQRHETRNQPYYVLFWVRQHTKQHQTHETKNQPYYVLFRVRQHTKLYIIYIMRLCNIVAPR